MAFDIDLEQPGGDELPEHAAPLPRVELGADAVGAQRFVAVLADLRGVRPTQDVDHVRGAEALAAAVDARQRLARRDGAVPPLRWIQAVVAMAAGAGMRFAKVAKQRLPSAAGGF